MPDSPASPTSPASALGGAILDLVLHVPASHEAPQQHPAARAHGIARAAARKASVLSGSMALPPGLLGWLTVMPELLGVWKLQAQMVSDIAGVYGKSQALGREQMLYCLFKHMSAQLFRDLVVRAGERVLVRKTSLNVLQVLAQKLGALVIKTVVRKGASRFVPLLGAVGVGAYAYYDTLQVARTAVALFERDIILNADTLTDAPAAVSSSPKKRAK